jgi:hypothetical protein
VNEVAEMDGTAALDPPELPGVELLLPLLPQAAMTRAALPASAVRPALLVSEFNETTSLVGGTCQDLR